LARRRGAVTPLQAGLLLAAGLTGGTVNAIAGGATFFTFPAMLAVGLPPVVANASNTVALWPASCAAALTDWRQLWAERSMAAPLIGIGLAGGLTGALLLLVTSNDTFRVLVPFLLLLATVVFAGSGRLLRWLRRHRPADRAGPRLRHPAILALIGFCAIYGGYFGAGIGIMMMAGLTVAGIERLHLANAMKNLLAAAINGIAVVVFVVSGIVAWPATLIMLAGAIGGGFLGARLARRIPAPALRAVVVTVGTLLTAWYFWRL
jgi:uncharacterized membrane protein YfcA